MEKITVFGAGYVGLVTAICFAECGHQVLCADINAEKIASLNTGISPIYEPGLSEMLQRNLQAKRIAFTTDMSVAVAHGSYQFIAVGTPAQENGAADLQAVYAVAKTIGELMQEDKIIINKSTVPVGTAKTVAHIVQETLSRRNVSLNFSMVANPEFLKQGGAVQDFMHPDRIIVGTDHNVAVVEKMRQLYAPVLTDPARLIAMDIASAELTKYAANAFLATKISFINEISQIAERVGADITQVRQGIIKDPRIGEHFLFAGCGYGGSCFPKDVNALSHIAESNGYVPHLLKAVDTINQQQKELLFTKLQHYFNKQIAGKVIALWGLAFKPNTDDMRDAPSRNLMESLWRVGARVRAYDPVAMKEAQRHYGQIDTLTLCDSAHEALLGADVLMIVTEWDEFKQFNLDTIKNTLKNPVIFDGRNIFRTEQMAAHGLEYFGIGRGRAENDENS
jgi:UDPglucose 6-dehydrogenase